MRAGAARGGARLLLRYAVGGFEGLRLPRSSPAPARAERLWEHTCLEAFVAPVGRACYWEVNLSPGGDWNVYRFDGHRSGMTPERRLPALAAFAAASATASGAGDTLTLEAALDLAPLSELGRGPLEVGLAAVLETLAGERSYWALRHARAEPDFHCRESFVLRLAEDGR